MGKDEERCALGSGHDDWLRKGEPRRAQSRTENAQRRSVELKGYIALLKLVNVVKIVSYVNYEDYVAGNAIGEECIMVLPGYSRELGGWVFNNENKSLLDRMERLEEALLGNVMAGPLKDQIGKLETQIDLSS
jgi:hypothetical protein